VTTVIYVRVIPLRTILVLRLCTPLTSLKLIATDFHEIWYERFAIGDNPNLVILNFLQSALTET